MNTRVKASLKPMKTAMIKDSKVDMQMQMEAEKPSTSTSTSTSRRGSVRDRKIALQQDVEKLRKRLRHEENVHRALERAFTRPLGALPRLPPYLPPSTLELLAEVAVLEEEVVRLEEQVVHFRQGLYQEAVYISSSKRYLENSADLQEQCPTTDRKNKASKISPQNEARNSPELQEQCPKRDRKNKASKLSPKIEANASTPVTENTPSLSDDVRGKENHKCTNSSKNKQRSPYLRNQTIKTPVKRSLDYKPAETHLDSPKSKIEGRAMESENVERRAPVIQEKGVSGDDNPNTISESILKCLMSIFVRMSSTRSKSMTEMLPSLVSLENLEEPELKDPYDISFEFGRRDIGPYKDLYAIEATSIKKNRTTNSVFLVQRLKLLLGKLASVDLKGLTHQEKLAFWINIYNSCMMNAFLEHGIPESPEMVVELMQKATINVGGHFLNAISIEHFVLRLPYHSKYTFQKGVKNDEITARSTFGLELSEPLVTFALSCGSWSSPAVRVYTTSQVENELEVAKRDYLQAAIGISTTKKMLAIPKLLDWYMLDFAKNMDSLLDWICLQLPSELGKEAMKCLEREKGEPLSHCVQVIPYEFRFRYLLYK